jgi:anaerobic selenocysteine-containing dehydrogenase
VRSVAALPAVSGNLGRPGTGFLYLNGFGNRGVDEAYMEGSDAFPTVPEPITHAELATTLEDPQRASALVCWNVNPVASCADQNRVRHALQRDDLFTVVSDLFPTDTADLADVVLPAASWLECDDIVIPYFHLSLAAQVKSSEPLGEALPNSEIFRRLATALEMTDRPLVEDDTAILARVMADSGTGLSFAELSQRGTVWLKESIQFEDRVFPTPSGRVELASAAAAADGHGALPRPHADARPAPGRLRLLSPASAWSINSSFSNDRKVARRGGELTLSMTAADAAAMDLHDGQPARVSSAAGSIVVPVRITDALPPGVGLIPKGGWPKLRPDGLNVNVLTLATGSDMGASSTVHGLEVEVVAAGTDGP